MEGLEDQQLDAEELGKARLTALRKLNRRECSVAQIRKLLTEREHDETVVESVISELLELRVLDDQRYCEQLIHDKRQLQLWGSERIVQALRTAGIELETTEKLAAELKTEDLKFAVELLRSRYQGKSDEMQDQRQRARAFGLLRRRGYSADHCYRAVDLFQNGSEP